MNTMHVVTATELARHLREILDNVEFRGDAVTITRNNRQIAHLLPGARWMTAKQAFSDLYGIVGEEAGTGWMEDSRTGETLKEGIRDPWAT